MADIVINDLTKHHGTIPVLSNLSLTLKEGSITAIIGPNGCGKSTLLKLLSGIDEPDSGTITSPHIRPFDFSYLFQGYSHSLLPWRTNEQNLHFPLELQHHSPDTINQRIEKLKREIDLPIDWHGYPYQLSGGQRQILAYMRALIAEPSVLFLDEPFSALDYEWTLRLRNHLQAYCAKHRPTVLIVTHSIEEAVYLADQILIFSKKPTQVSAVINNALARPRTIQTIASDKFVEVQRNTLSSFKNVLSHE